MTRYNQPMLDFVISLMMLAVAVLAVGAVFLFRRGDRKRAGLMGFLALVVAVNVAIWLVPTESGDTLAGSVAAE